MPRPIRIAIAGARGHMGRAVVLAVEQNAAFEYLGGIARPGVQADSIIDLASALENADVIVDFSTGAAATALAEQCAAHGGPALVIGATGFEPEELARISVAARSIAIVRSGNFSPGVNMLMGLVRQVAEAFPAEDWDLEIFEAHHRRKIDAPSGTALMLGEAAAEGRGVELPAVARHGREGVTGERPQGEIGFSVMRGGGITGEHSVVFAGDSEVITLSHTALDRGMFASGALAAAKWLVGQPAGEYDMQHVLGLAGTR